MKKKIVFSLLLALIFILSYSTPALAYQPDFEFGCCVTEEKIPPNTMYIDFLLPISTDEECYVDFNSENGKKFGISKESEIVNYCEDGYISYTFHVVDAISNLSPSTWYDLNIPNSIYEKNSELFDDFEHVTKIERENEQYYSVYSVKYKSETHKKIEKLEKKFDISVSQGLWYTTYNTDFEREEPSKFDYNYCCKKFKKAKMAYLDKDGNVLLVSNAAEIDGLVNRSGHLNLELSGTEFTSNPDPALFWVLYDAFIIAFPIWLALLAIVGAVVLIVIKVKKRKRNR